MDVGPDSAQMEGDSSMTIREVPSEMMGCLQNIEQYMNARLEVLAQEISHSQAASSQDGIHIQKIGDELKQLAAVEGEGDRARGDVQDAEENSNHGGGSSHDTRSYGRPELSLQTSNPEE